MTIMIKKFFLLLLISLLAACGGYYYPEYSPGYITTGTNYAPRYYNSAPSYGITYSNVYGNGYYNNYGTYGGYNNSRPIMMAPAPHYMSPPVIMARPPYGGWHGRSGWGGHGWRR